MEMQSLELGFVPFSYSCCEEYQTGVCKKNVTFNPSLDHCSRCIPERGKKNQFDLRIWATGSQKHFLVMQTIVISQFQGTQVWTLKSEIQLYCNSHLVRMLHRVFKLLSPDLKYSAVKMLDNFVKQCLVESIRKRTTLRDSQRSKRLPLIKQLVQGFETQYFYDLNGAVNMYLRYCLQTPCLHSNLDLELGYFCNYQNLVSKTAVTIEKYTPELPWSD